MARTETVTVVFSDLVGSTALAGRLGHDACELLLLKHIIEATEPLRLRIIATSRNAPGDRPRAAALITAALAETGHLDMPAEAAKLQWRRERLAHAGT